LHALTDVTRLAVRLAAVTLGVAAVGVVAQPPAQAATCGSASGVSVVVDFHQLGGGVQTFCDAGGAGKYADKQFVDAGHSLTYVQRQPGFVCRVDGTPASDPCVNTPPADAYWSLWWSDGKSGTWTYSSTGVASLKVPAGGYVALSWQQGSAKAAPGVAPTAHPSSPTTHPTTHPTRHPTRHPSQSPTSPSSSSPVTPGPASTSSSGAPASGSSTSPSSAGPAKAARARGTKATKATRASHPHTRASDDGSPSSEPTDSAVPTEAGGPLDPTSGSSAGGGGLPGWVAPAAVLLLFGAAGTVVVVRRRRSGGV
jgi:hypothetical protein